MEWMCSECGAPHPKNNPPCKNCGAMQFEKTVVRQQADDEKSSANVEWDCTECGRRHPKNNPPCNDCGHMQFESVEVDRSVEDVETAAGLGTRDVLKFLGVVVTVGIVVVAVTNAGLLDENKTPTVENVPGDANTSSGLDLNTVEVVIYEQINERRSSEGRDDLSLEPETRAMAEYYNQLMVKRGEYPLERPPDDVFEGFGSCSTPSLAYNRLEYGDRAIDYYDSEGELARELSSSWLADSETGPILLDSSVSTMGVDVHVAEDGTVFATVTLC